MPIRSERRWMRHRSNLRIRVHREDVGGGEVVEGTCITLSDGGMCFFAVGDFPTGARIGVEFDNPILQQAGLLRGTIRNRTIYLYGVEYEILTPPLQKDFDRGLL